MRIPATITNITTINRQAVALSPGSVLLTAPIHAHQIIISWLHLLLVVHLETLCCSHVLHEHLVLGETDRAERWLLDMVGGVKRGLRVGAVWCVGVGVGVGDWRWVDYGLLWNDLGTRLLVKLKTRPNWNRK
jgi:hypothetical protein